jgi:hypothetical protein
MRSKAEVGESKQGSAPRSGLIFLVGTPGDVLSASSGNGRCSALALSTRDVYRSRAIGAVSKPLQLVRSRAFQPSLV